MEWLRLLAPSAAVLALFLGIGLLVQSIRHGRAIRRLEQRIADGEGAASRASLERIAALQARPGVSTGAAPGRSRVRPILFGLGAVVLAALVVAGGWWFLGRGDSDPAGPQAEDTPAATTTNANPPPDGTSVPTELPPLQDKAQFEVAVFNASGVSRAAADKVLPTVEAEGYIGGLVDDAPDGTSDLKESVVMYTDGNRRLGFQLAQDLGVERAIPLEGITEEQAGGADAVVLIGLDLAG
jgi:hypothetical protein